MVKTEILKLVLVPNRNTALAALVDTEQRRVLLLRIGALEAHAIALGINQMATARPMTHDLMKNILEEFQVEVQKVVITELKGGTFGALIHIGGEGKNLEINCRPSDAIALAVRVNAPIYCSEEVIDAAADLGLLRPLSDFDDSETLERWMKTLKPEAFGKYRM